MTSLIESEALDVVPNAPAFSISDCCSEVLVEWPVAAAWFSLEGRNLLVRPRGATYPKSLHHTRCPWSTRALDWSSERSALSFLRPRRPHFQICCCQVGRRPTNMPADGVFDIELLDPASSRSGLLQRCVVYWQISRMYHLPVGAGRSLPNASLARR